VAAARQLGASRAAADLDVIKDSSGIEELVHGGLPAAQLLLHIPQLHFRQPNLHAGEYSRQAAWVYLLLLLLLLLLMMMMTMID
jgi:hypothetical protein